MTVHDQLAELLRLVATDVADIETKEVEAGFQRTFPEAVTTSVSSV